MPEASKIVNKLLESDPDSPETYLSHVAAHIEQTRNAAEMAELYRVLPQIDTWMRDTTEPYDDWKWDGNELVVFLNGEPIERYDRATVYNDILKEPLAEAADPDAPQPYVDWLGQKTEVGSLDKIRFGAYIHTSNEDSIRENAAEAGIDVDSQAFWDEIERCLAIIESNALQVLREAGLHVNDEGHAGDDGARVASVWIDTPEEDRKLALLKGVINWAEGDWPSTSSGTMDYAFGANTTQRLYAMTEDAARFVEVTIEFTGTDALVEWSKLNLNEAIEGNPDDPEVFLKSYVPRMKGRVMIEFNQIKPNFPDAPANWYREDADGTLLFRYNRASEMRALMTQAYIYNRTREDRAGIEQVTYRFHVPNPSGHILARQFLEQAGVNKSTMEWVIKTNAPIWFYVPVKEFNDYMKMVYPQVKLHEADEDVDPKAYLDATTGWIDNFLNAGMTPNQEDTHRGQFWKRYECHGFNYLVNLSTRTPRWITVERNDALYGTNAFRRVFEYPDRYVKGMLGDFAALDRILTRARTSAYESGHHFDHKIIKLHDQHKRNRQKFLDGRLKEALDDPEMQRYLDKAVREPCFHCGNDLSKPHTVIRTYVQRNGLTHELSGHYDEDGYYTNDDKIGANLLAALPECDLPEDCDTCMRCGKSTIKDRPRRTEAVDDPTAYMRHLVDLPVYTIDEIREKMQNYGLSFYMSDDGFMPWGRWLVIKGFTYWAVHRSGKNIQPPFVRDQLDKFCRDMRLTPYKVQLWGSTPQDISFKLAIPKMQVDPESWKVKQWHLDNPDFREMAQANDTMQREWLPEDEQMAEPIPDDPLSGKLREIDDRKDIAHAKKVAREYLAKLRAKRAESLDDLSKEQLIHAGRPTNCVEPCKECGAFCTLLHYHLPNGTLMPQYHICQTCDVNSAKVEEAADPDDPSVNIERHVGDLDIDAVMNKLGFVKQDKTRPDGWDLWHKTVDNKQWRIWPTTLTNVYGITRLERPAKFVRVGRGKRYGQWSDKGHFTCHVTELEQQLREEGALNEALAVPDPDDPSVNVDRHMASMDIDAIMDRLGFMKLTPSWKCADPDYCWYQLHHGNFKWTVTRKSDDEPQMFEIDISRWKPIQGAYGSVPNYQQIGSAKVHVGELENKIKEVLQKPLKIIWRGMGIHPDEVDESVGDPDAPEPNIERFAQHVDAVAQKKLDDTINSALADFDNAVEMRGINSARKADEKAVEVATFWAEQAGYENGSDEFDWLVSAVNNRAGERFPGDWEDYEESKKRYVVLPIKSVMEMAVSADYPNKTWPEIFKHFENRPYKADIAALVRSFRLRGVQSPIHLHICEGDPKIYCGNGHHRLWLSHKLGFTHIRVRHVNEEKQDWMEWMQILVDERLITQRDADRYQQRQNDQSNEELTMLICALDELGEMATDEQMMDTFQKMANIVRITNMRYGSALRDLTKDIKVDESEEQAWPLPGGFKIVRYSDENTLELRTPKNKPIGFIAWRSADDRVGIKYRTVELEHLEVNPHYQNRGLGEALIRQFVALVPQLYPDARFVVARTATSQGVVTLLRKVFGPEVKARNLDKLPAKSPDDWIHTMNRGYALFKLPRPITEADEGNPENYIKQLPIPIKAKVVGLNRRTRDAETKEFDAEMYFDHLARYDDLEKMIALAKEEFQTSYVADDVARFFSDSLLADFFKEHTDEGFEVYVDNDDVKRWVEHNKPEWFPYLWPDDMVIESKETVDYPAVYVDKRIFIGPSHATIIRHLEDTSIPLTGTVLHGWWTSRNRFLATDIDVNELMRLSRKFAQRTGENPGLRGEELPKAKQITGVREVSESVDDPDDPSMVLTAHTQDLAPDAEQPQKIRSHTHGEFTAQLQALGFESSWVAGREVVFGEPYVPTFWSKRYPGSVLYVKLNTETGDAVLSIRSRRMSIPIRLKVRTLAHAGAIVKDVDAAMQQLPREVTKDQEREAVINVLDHHRQWCVNLGEGVDIPPEDEPGNVIPAAEKSLVMAELKKLDFGPKPEMGIATIYDQELPRYWWNRYEAADGQIHGINIYFISGSQPEIRANNWNFVAKAWFQRGKDAPTDCPAKSQAHFAAIIHDLDAAMKRSAEASLSPEQEHESIQAVLKHHRQWWDETLDYLINTQGGRIPGRIGPPQAA